MKNNKLAALGMAMCLATSLAVPAFATDVSASGGTGSVPVNLTAEAATFSVTVPTALTINVNAAGQVTTASDAKIVNNSHGAVKVTGVGITGQDGWETVDFDSANMATEKVGAKKVAMQINNDKTTGANQFSFTEGNWAKIDGKVGGTAGELAINYDAKVPAQAAQISNTAIANVVFTIGWDTVAGA